MIPYDERMVLYHFAQERHWFLKGTEEGWRVYADWLEIDEDHRLGEGNTPEDAIRDAMGNVQSA